MVKPSSLYSPSPEQSLLQQNPPINNRYVQNMMIGETLNRSNPTVQIPIPHWDPYMDDPPSPILSPYSPSPFHDSLTALHRFLPSNDDEDLDLPVDAFSCDHFRMYEFKVRKCARGRSHDWTECPYAHAGEKARRRDPRKYHYSGTACPDFRKGGCRKGDSCEFAHGVFECWLHPARYRTQPCKDGQACRRRVCFFAHTPEQLRILPQTYPNGNGSGSGEMDFGSPPFSYLAKSGGSFVSSPTSILTSPPVSPPSDSPPMSPSSPQVMSELVASMRLMRMGSASGSGSWAMQGGSGSCSGSRMMLPRGSLLRPGFCSMPSTPTRGMTRPGLSQVELLWDNGCEEEPAMERVESGRDLRARLYAKLSKENSLDRAEAGGSGPDVGWISELVK